MTNTPEPASPANDADEVKRKFKEALERKNGEETARQARQEGREQSGTSSKGPAQRKRTFRRKSG